MSKKAGLRLFGLLAVFVAGSLQAQEVFKADNSVPLNDAASWVDGTAPTAADIAAWDSRVGAGNVTVEIGGALTWDGLLLTDPAAAVTINGTDKLTLDGGATTDIDMSAATRDLTINTVAALGGSSVVAVNAGRVLTFNGTTSVSGVTVENHVAIGTEIQSIAPQIAAPKHGSCAVPEKQLAAFTEKLALLSPDELVRQLHVHYSGSEGIVPALQTNLALARRFGDEIVHVPASEFHKDLMLDLMNESALTSGFAEEIIASAREVGKKYKVDQKHAEHVMNFAQQIFRELKHLHGLGTKHELLLRVAASLHEVGMFLSAREHHKHSMYLILNTELFGISTDDRTVVALLARYHRRYNPENNHPHFSDLTREERMVVFKLAAILRIADALDRTHSQRIRSIILKTQGNRLIIQTPGVADTAVEQAAINGKCDLFREIFGYEIVLSKA